MRFIRRRRATSAGDSAPHGPDQEASVERDPAERAKRLRRIGAVAVVAGLLGLGANGGWWLRGRFGDNGPPVVNVRVDRPVLDASGANPAREGMPSVVGLSQANAGQVLFDAGLGATAVRFEQVPAAGEAGVVVRQRPAPGQPFPPPEGVVLDISTPASVPALVGKSEQDARSALAALGATVKATRVYRPGVDEGTVVATTPPEGERLVDEVQLTLAAAPSSIFVAQLDAVEDDCSDGTATVNGTELPASLLCSVGGSSPTAMEYVLNRQVTSFEATIGQSDRGETGIPVRFVVLVDGRRAADQTVGFGATAPLAVDVSGALRVRIEMTAAVPEGRCCPSASAVLGSARFVGAPDAIDALGGAKKN